MMPSGRWLVAVVVMTVVMLAASPALAIGRRRGELTRTCTKVLHEKVVYC